MISAVAAVAVAGAAFYVGRYGLSWPWGGQDLAPLCAYIVENALESSVPYQNVRDVEVTYVAADRAALSFNVYNAQALPTRVRAECYAAQRLPAPPLVWIDGNPLDGGLVAELTHRWQRRQ